MKKQDIKKDPIRDKIINFITEVGDNKKKYFNYFMAISLLLLAVIIFTNNKSNKMNDYNLNVSVNQNKYIDGIDDISVSNFNEIINTYSSSESYNQAYIYLLNHYLENNDYDSMKKIIDDNKFNSSDSTLESMVYNIYANYYLVVNDYKNAEKFYKKSINISKVPEHINKFKLNLIYLYLNTNQKQKAVNVLDKINIDDVVPYQLKNKFEQLKSL